MRLIDADKLNARLSRNGTPYYTVPDIENAPTVDAAPIRHGRWIGRPLCGTARCRCSECGNWWSVHALRPEDTLQKYCPGCGAKMDKE